MKAHHVSAQLFNMQKVTHEPRWEARVVPSCHLSQKATCTELQGTTVAWSGESTTWTSTNKKLSGEIQWFYFSFFFFNSVDGRGHPQRNMTSKRKQQQLLDNAVSHGCPTGLAGECRLSAERMWRKTSPVCVFEDRFVLRVRQWEDCVCWTYLGLLTCTYAAEHVSKREKAGGKKRDVLLCCFVVSWTSSVYMSVKCMCEDVLCLDCPCLAYRSTGSRTRPEERSGQQRGSQPLVCAVTLMEGFLRQGATGEDSREQWALCVCVCVWW